jgi:alpha-1,6-mannosyltransferase
MCRRTLHLTNAWHATSGGIGTFYRSLLDAANAIGHELRLVVPGERDGVEEAGAYGRIYHVRSPRAPLNRSYRVMFPDHYLRARGEIRRIVDAERPDLIEICDKYTLPYLGGLLRVGKLRGIDLRVPIVGLSCERMDENMLAYVSASGAGRSFSRWYMKNIYFPQFDHHIANSEHTAEELREASRGHKVRRGVWVCPMGVDVARFSPRLRSMEMRASLLERCGGSAASSILLYVGRLAPEKNLPLLVDTLEELVRRERGDYRLVIAGQGMSRSSLERTCRRRVPGRFCFLEHVADRAELSRVYASSDIFVHPNPREPFGIAPLEAMASGLPLVAPNAGGVISYANASNAWLASPEARAFADAVEAVGADRRSRQLRLARGLETAALFDWPAISRDFLKLYAEMIELYRGERSEPARAPKFYSTLGDAWGRELC